MLQFIKNTINVCNDTMRFYRTLFELSKLSDRELADLGMTRDQIPRVAMESSLTK